MNQYLSLSINERINIKNVLVREYFCFDNCLYFFIASNMQTNNNVPLFPLTYKFLIKLFSNTKKYSL